MDGKIALLLFRSAKADLHLSSKKIKKLFDEFSNFAPMEKPVSYRMQIPFFIKKSETDFQKDLYERFDDMVVFPI